ncbi:outer membrane protein assembly factor BamC [uncultured Thiothrix sp.]|uniref:outer membrane protein assembly factor BamC n=1 Tax=uncultured Thiothrix sp. TaxID=223185 RepID=UPI002605F23F|nr:outer membrane protein assembly factor BamC [uncultured Thiothrix sp.]
MISSKRARSTLVIAFAFSSAVLVSGCSWLKIDSITDTVNYRGNSGSIANLEIPPGLSAPAFDSTYTIQRPVSAADVAPPTQAAIVAGQSGVVMPNSAGLNASLSSLKDGNPVLAVAGRYDQVWAKTGQALGRMGLTVANQQYEQGIYTVTATNAEEEKDKNVISRFMSYLSFKIVDGKETKGTSYRFIIGDRGVQSLIVVSDEAGKPVKAEEASALLTRLKAELAQ